MKAIKSLVECIRVELDAAERYAKKATENKVEDRATADVYARLAEARLAAVDMLHAQAVRLIQEYKSAGKGPVPAAMQAVWDWEHSLMVETVSRINALLAAYKTAR